MDNNKYNNFFDIFENSVKEKNKDEEKDTTDTESDKKDTSSVESKNDKESINKDDNDSNESKDVIDSIEEKDDNVFENKIKENKTELSTSDTKNEDNVFEDKIQNNKDTVNESISNQNENDETSTDGKQDNNANDDDSETNDHVEKLMDSEDFKKAMSIAVGKVLYDIKSSNKSIKVDKEDFIPNEKGEIPGLEKEYEPVLEKHDVKEEKEKKYYDTDYVDFDKKIIEVRNLVKSFKNGKTSEVILKNIDFDIIDSAITTIVGPSGSGKTTILNLLSGLDSADSGKISVDGMQLVGMSENQLINYRLEKLGFIFQSYNLIADLTVKENVQIVESLSKDPMDVDEVLKLVSLDHAADKYPHQLSGGMQQRVSIARALVKNPKILVCDEPTGALDENTGKDILSLLQDLPKKTNTAIILVTHNPGIKAMSHVVIEVKDGLINDNYINEKVVDAKDVEWG